MESSNAFRKALAIGLVAGRHVGHDRHRSLDPTPRRRAADALRTSATNGDPSDLRWIFGLEVLPGAEERPLLLHRLQQPGEPRSSAPGAVGDEAVDGGSIARPSFDGQSAPPLWETQMASMAAAPITWWRGLFRSRRPTGAVADARDSSTDGGRKCQPFGNQPADRQTRSTSASVAQPLPAGRADRVEDAESALPARQRASPTRCSSQFPNPHRHAAQS